VFFFGGELFEHLRGKPIVLETISDPVGERRGISATIGYESVVVVR
jgi:hypothetical protein